MASNAKEHKKGDETGSKQVEGQHSSNTDNDKKTKAVNETGRGTTKEWKSSRWKQQRGIEGLHIEHPNH